MAGRDARFGVLGPLEFERDSQPVPVPSGTQRSLLALLLLGGGVPLALRDPVGQLTFAGG